MKFVYFVPLSVFVVFFAAGVLVNVPKNPATLFQLAGFLFGFCVTYVFGIRSTQKNKEAVQKVRAASPYLVPLLSFVISTVVTTSIFIPRNPPLIAAFCAVCLIAVIAYAVGILLLLRDVKRQEVKSASTLIRPGATDKKLVLVNPVQPERTGLAHTPASRFPPLCLGILAALTPKRFEVEIIDENIEPFRFRDADLVGITAFTSSAPRAYEIAAQYRARGVPVILGGIHASMQPDEAMGFVDTVVTGEAEGIWPGLIDDFLHGRMKRRYDGRPSTLENLPIARRDLFNPEYLFATVQTARGCPMDCTFCSVTAFNGRTRRERPVKEVLDELATLPNRQIFFVDDNIVGKTKASRQRAAALFRGMVERRFDKTWFCQASLNFGMDDTLLYWARKAGCKMVFLGLESPDPSDLDAMNKRENRNGDIGKILRNIHRHKIAVLGAFIHGTPNETPASLRHKTDYALKHPIDVVHVTVMTPLPGTRLFEEEAKRGTLRHTEYPDDWSKYDMGMLTFDLKNMSKEEFMLHHERCNRRIYSRIRLVRSFFKTLIQTKSIESALWAWSSNNSLRHVALYAERPGTAV